MLDMLTVAAREICKPSSGFIVTSGGGGGCGKGDESERRVYTEDTLGEISTRIQNSSRKSLRLLEQEIGLSSFKFTLTPKISSAGEYKRVTKVSGMGAQ
jgi:hypothetical protein